MTSKKHTTGMRKSGNPSSVFIQLYVCIYYVYTSFYLAQVRYGEAECISIAGARIHIVPDKEDDL